MPRTSKKPKIGFTLLELLIVISIISLLLQMIVPAVQSARETARRMSCANNLRNLGLAVLTYESTYKKLPPSHNNEPRHNCVQYLLPYLEQQALFEKYDFKQDWDSTQNKPVTDTELEILLCPTAPREYPYVSDYATCVQVDKKLADELIAEGHIRERSDLLGLLRHRRRPLSMITDGLSNTIVFSEMSGRPNQYQFGELKKVSVVPGSRWGDKEAPFSIGSRCDGAKLKRGSQLLNCTNWTEIYSFHNQGANFAFGDGSTRFIFQDVDPDVFISLITASAAD